MSLTFAKDVTHSELPTLAQGILAALYTTGSPDIKATQSDFNAHPNAVRICQDHGSDDTADILDMETGAATPQDCANWIPKARASFNSNKRPGQRWPGIYASLSRITDVANAFVAAKITNVPLWIAEWGVAISLAESVINTASGPFPVIGVQYQNEQNDDLDIFSTAWVNRRSGMATPTNPPANTVKAETPPGQWNTNGNWTWNEAVIIGVGTDGNLYTFAFNPSTGGWIRQSLPGLERD